MPLSAATTRYGSSGSCRRTCGGGTMLVADAVVGEIEERAQIVLVAGDPFLHVGVAIGGGRRALQHEAALRADGNDHDVLHHLRLHEAQDLGAEILGPIGPAEPAARDRATAQVNAFEARRIDEDLEHRQRLGQAGHFRRIELERQEACAACPAASRRQKFVRVVATISASTAAARDPPTGSRRLRARSRSPRGAPSRRLVGRLLSGSNRALNSATRLRAIGGVRGERRLDEGLRQRKADLAHVFRIRAQHDDLRGGNARRHHQPVEVVVLHLAAEDAAERVLEHLRAARRCRRRRPRSRVCMPKSCSHIGGTIRRRHLVAAARRAP